MFERGIDMAAYERGDHHDHRRQHQSERDVLERLWRVPYVDPAGRAIMRKTPGDQNDPCQRNQGVTELIATLSHRGDGTSAQLTLRRQGMDAKEQGKAQDHHRQSHVFSPPKSLEESPTRSGA